MDKTAAKPTDRGSASSRRTIARGRLAALERFWTDAQYLTLTNHSHRLIDFTDGCIEILPMGFQKKPGDFAIPVHSLGLVASVRDSLRNNPGARLHRLRGDRVGQWAVPSTISTVSCSTGTTDQPTWS